MNNEDFVRRTRGSLPFGYTAHPTNKALMVPVPQELEALNYAFGFLSRRCSLREVARWLETTTGRSIAISGLRRAFIKNQRLKHGPKIPMEDLNADPLGILKSLGNR